MKNDYKFYCNNCGLTDIKVVKNQYVTFEDVYCCDNCESKDIGLIPPTLKIPENPINA
jgi:predicted SprT family Zn-dependent metalloprotease